jgi:hypothetical protein
MVRHDVARGFKAGESIEDGMSRIDHASITLSGATHLLSDHQLFI